MKHSSFDQALNRVQLKKILQPSLLKMISYRHITPKRRMLSLVAVKTLSFWIPWITKLQRKHMSLSRLHRLLKQMVHSLIMKVVPSIFTRFHIPTNKYIKESWKWLLQMKTLLSQSGNGQDHHPEELLRRTLKTHFRNLQEYQNRYWLITCVWTASSFHGSHIATAAVLTAMHANINVSEPKPLQDEDSPLSYTMEGYKGIPPDSAIPFFGRRDGIPVQSVNKYQEEVGGLIQKEIPGSNYSEWNQNQ